MERRKKDVPLFSLRESQIQRAIMDLLTAEHIFAIRWNTGHFRDSRGVPVQTHSGGKGVADVQAFIPAEPCGTVEAPDARFQRVLWIEVKRPGNKQTPEQATFQRHVETLGHYYLLATSSDQVLAWLRSVGASQ